MTSWTRDLDAAIVLATSAGSFHVVLFLLLCALAAVPTAFLAFSQVFTSATPAHWCSASPALGTLNLTLQELRLLTIPRAAEHGFEQCLMYDVDMSRFRLGLHADEGISHPNASSSSDGQYNLEGLWNASQAGSWPVVPCRYGWTFDNTHYDATLVTELQLVCERSWWPRASNTLFWVGSIFGNLLFGWLSDRWGRRPTILLMVLLEVPLAIATSFSPNYTLYTALRLLSGLFFPALYQVPFILALELMPPSMRTYTGMVIGMLFAAGMCLLALLAFLLRDWFKLSLATSAPFVILYSSYWLVPESPRWLVTRGRVSEAEEVLRKMARANGIHLQHGFLVKLHKEDKMFEASEETPTVQINGKNTDKETSDFPSKRTRLQSPKPKITNKPETDATNTADMERILEFEVSEIVHKKSRLKKDNSRKNIAEDSYLIEEMSKDDHNKCLNDNDEKESHNSKSIQTDELEIQSNKNRKLINLRTSIDKSVQRFEIDSNVDDRDIEEYSTDGDNDAGPLDLFRYPNIRKKFFILTLDWIANAVVYNGLSYNSSNLGVNDYLAFFIGGAVELPSYLIAWKLMDRFGRRWVLCVTMCVGGLACLSCVLVPEDRPWVTVALAMVGRLCVAASFAVFYVFVGELLPTVLRAQAMGASSFLSGLGLLACPYIVHLAVYSRVLPLAIMGTLSLAGALASLFLPETLHQPLPQTTRDGEDFGKDFKIFSCPARRED